MTTPTSEILNKAADLIESRGWTSGSYGWNKEGAPLCLEGGIAAAMGLGEVASNWAQYGELQSCPPYRAVASYLEDDSRWGIFRENLYSWNDVQGRTAEQVIEVLRATAVIEAARENSSVTERVSA